MQLGLIVRCKNELYINEFVKYYLNQGIDLIYIIDDNSNKDIYSDIKNMSNVKIIFEKNIIEKNFVSTLYKSIRNDFDWIIFVDVDEYIITKKNFNKTIRDELETTFKDIDCIKIPWVMFSSCKNKFNPKSLLLENTFRWNHDLQHINKLSSQPKFRCRYENIEVKCIFKPKYFEDIFDHCPQKPICNVKIVNSINCNQEDNNNYYYKNLRETDIKNGYMLCYHYRIVSEEQCLEKIKYNIWYKNYTLNDLLSSDYSEIEDTSMKDKFHNI